MKRRSKLFLIVSLILVGVGAVLCIAGYIVGNVRGEQLFADKLEGGERGYTYEFKDGDLDILKLNVDDADINIIGGADTPHIEIIDFNESLYTLEISGAMVTFRQSPDFSSIASFWEGGFSFKGLRYFFHPGTGRGEGIINIYINEDEYIKVFDLTSQSGKISVSDVDSVSDWQLHPGSGGVSMKNISNASTVNITSQVTGSIDILIDRLKSENVNITAPEAKLNVKKLDFRVLNVQQSHGIIDIDCAPADSEYTVNVVTSGKLTVDGESYIDTYKYPEKDKNATQSDKNNGDDEKTVSSVSINTSVSSADASTTLNIDTTHIENDKEKEKEKDD